MSFPIDPRRLLTGAPADELVQVVSILFDAVRARCAAAGLAVGSVVLCTGVADRHLRLDVVGHGPLLLPLSLAVCVEVEPVDAEFR